MPNPSKRSCSVLSGSLGPSSKPTYDCARCKRAPVVAAGRLDLDAPGTDALAKLKGLLQHDAIDLCKEKREKMDCWRVARERVEKGEGASSSPAGKLSMNVPV